MSAAEGRSHLPAAFTHVVASLTSVGAQPTAIAELLGRRCRVYSERDVITMDYVAGRANIVLDRSRGVIVRIWFG